jgi:hypothetical protein
MKKTFIALIMCIAISAQAFASQDIIVNHSKKTVTIQANFTSVAPISKTLNQAADLWNSRSGKYYCDIETNDGIEKYTVNFKVLVNQNTIEDIATNVITVLPNNHELFKRKMTDNSNNMNVNKNVVCVTDGKVIGISEKYKKNKYVLAHEMGHNLGLKHTGTHACCNFSMKDLAIFKIKSSVTELASVSNKKDATTRRRIILYAYNHDYGYEPTIKA